MKRGPWPQRGRVSPDEAIVAILRQAEGFVPVPELCREHERSNASLYKWRAKNSGMDASLISSSAALYDSLQRILAMPPETRLYVGRDYAPDRPAACIATVAKHRAFSIDLANAPDQPSLIYKFYRRDATLASPTLTLAARQVNIRGSRAPEPQGNGI